jgi:hypothetical protein
MRSFGCIGLVTFLVASAFSGMVVSTTSSVVLELWHGGDAPRRP